MVALGFSKGAGGCPAMPEIRSSELNMSCDAIMTHIQYWPDPNKKGEPLRTRLPYCQALVKPVNHQLDHS
jgi:hypothetical protein